MVNCRVWSAGALLCAAACSFPTYEVPSADVEGLATTCRDGVRNGEERGIDCGPGCDPCPVCSDDMRNGDETGVDCGGSCNACPTCDDELQNGSESDVDCGGTCGQRCDTDRRCRENADCASLVCDKVCQPSSCNDGVRNGHETGEDCGGSCAGCLNGSACDVNGDCASARCQNQVCVSAGCTDGILNGLETGEDCGGAECAPCQASDSCALASDCDSQICTKQVCVAASCSDSLQNQGESAVDCGGPACPACAVGKSCSGPTDCESGLCQNGTCVPEFPTGQLLSRSKWTLSSSVSSTEEGLQAPFDSDADSCWLSGRPQYDGMYVQLDLGQPEIFFKALVLITATRHPNDFPGGLDVYVSSSGTFGDVSSRVPGNQWTWIDFQSAQVGRYLRFVVTEPKPDLGWSISEISLYN